MTRMIGWYWAMATLASAFFLMACGGAIASQPDAAVQDTPDTGTGPVEETVDSSTVSMSADTGLPNQAEPDSAFPSPPDAADVSTVMGTDDAGTDDASFPAAHAAIPQVPTAGGSVLASPQIVLVTFSGDTLVSQEQDFLTKLAASSYWNVLSQYGVGTPTILANVPSSETVGMTIDDTAIQTFVDDNVGTTLPANNGSVLYLLVYPSTVTITLGGAQSCDYFGGYHSETSKGNVYAVVPQCPTLTPQFTTVIDDVTGSASHEIGEAVTDPHPYTNPAYNQGVNNLSDGPWAVVFGGGGEIGDMCAQNPDAFFIPADLGFVVQRLWSNQAIAANEDPCEPAPAGEVYFNSAPNLTSTVNLPQGFGESYGIPISAVGQSVTVEVDVFSNAPTGPLTVSAFDVGGEEATPMTTELSFAFNPTTGQNGSKLQLTVTLVAQDPNGFEQGVLTTTDGTTTKLWPFVVMVN